MKLPLGNASCYMSASYPICICDLLEMYSGQVHLSQACHAAPLVQKHDQIQTSSWLRRAVRPHAELPLQQGALLRYSD